MSYSAVRKCCAHVDDRRRDPYGEDKWRKELGHDDHSKRGHEDQGGAPRTATTLAVVTFLAMMFGITLAKTATTAIRGDCGPS